MAEKAILFDATKCIACRACQVACKQWNELEGERTTNRGSYENPPNLSPQTRLKMRFVEVVRQEKPGWLFARRACMHCTDAACIKVCPTKALSRHELGFVTYNKDLCSGCGYCLEFCPFQVPQSERNLLTGVAKMEKCTLCTTPGLDRLAEGWESACVKTCPTDALVFGDRSTLVTEGEKRVQTIKAKGYSGAYLYGANELGGLHVMYVLDDSPQVYGLPADPKFPVVSTAWKDVMQPLGLALGGLTILGLGLNFLVARQAKLNRELAVAKEKKDAARS